MIDIINYNGEYKIDRGGNVYSFKNKRFRRLKLDYSSRGYARVTLSKNGNTRRFLVHRLVYRHFAEDYREDRVVNHIDAIKINNHISNLEMVTQKENIMHSMKLKLQTFLKGEQVYASILTDNSALLIRRLLGSGYYNQRELAEIFGVSQGTISDLWLRKTWKHI